MDLWSPGTAGCVGVLDGKDLPMLTGSRGRELAILVKSGDRVELVVGFRSGSPGWLSEYKGLYRPDSKRRQRRDRCTGRFTSAGV
jgi:hypothetical protein